MPRNISIRKTKLVPMRNKLDHEGLRTYSPGIASFKVRGSVPVRRKLRPR